MVKQGIHTRLVGYWIQKVFWRLLDKDATAQRVGQVAQVVNVYMLGGCSTMDVLYEDGTCEQLYVANAGQLYVLAEDRAALPAQARANHIQRLEQERACEQAWLDGPRRGWDGEDGARARAQERIGELNAEIVQLALEGERERQACT
jgi:hypothetical protein